MRSTPWPILAAASLLVLAVACGGGGDSGPSGNGNPGGAGGSGGDGGSGGGGTGGGDGLPGIDRLEPDHGLIGASVTIHGHHFAVPASRNRVFFAGQESSALAVDAEGTRIETKVPANATTGQVRLLVDGVNVDGPTFTVDPYPAPHLLDVSPDRVAVGEPATIVLTGTDFRPLAKVVLDGTPTSGRYVSPTRIELDLAASLLAREETHTLKVVVDPPGGGSSETLEFEAVRRFALLEAVATSATGVELRFEEALVEAAAVDVSNYSLNPALAVRAATRDAGDPRLVRLVTDPQELGVRYGLTVADDLLSEQGHLSAVGEDSFLAFGSPPEHAVTLAVSGCDGFALSGPGAMTRIPGGFLLVERTGHQVQILNNFGGGQGYYGHNGTDARRHDGTGDDAAGCPGETGSPADGAFRLPRGAVVRMANGDLIVGDTGNGRVQRWSSGGAYRGVFGTGFTSPVVLGVVGGNVWIADADDAVHVYSLAGTPVETFGGPGDTVGTFSFGLAAGETPTLAQIAGASPSLGYLADPANHRVLMVLDGDVVGFLGGGVPGFRATGSCCAAGNGPAAFDGPRGVAIDSEHRLLVVDGANGGRLQRFTDGQPDFEMTLGYLPGGIAVGSGAFGDFWLISEPAGDQLHSYQP